jgi:hypothetical protein
MTAIPASEPGANGAAPPAEDRRSAPRHRIQRRCLVRPASGPGSVSWKGIAYDVSAAGIGIALPYPLATGTVLVIEPQGPPPVRAVQVRVVRLAPVAFLWFCGCELTVPLCDAELKAWVGEPA